MLVCAQQPINNSRRPDLSGPLSIAKPDWEAYCHKVADLIIGEQTPARVMEVRSKFYELLSHCILPPSPHPQGKASLLSDVGPMLIC